MRAFLLMLLLVVTRKNETYMAGSYKKKQQRWCMEKSGQDH
jgi:hypothetical protein